MIPESNCCRAPIRLREFLDKFGNPIQDVAIDPDEVYEWCTKCGKPCKWYRPN